MPSDLARQQAPTICVVGALAYDLIGSTESELAGTDKSLNCKLTDLIEDFGGCAGNIAYNLAHLQVRTALVSVVGEIDFEPYRARLEALDVELRHLLRSASARCARALIFTGRDGAQFTAFYPGPLVSSDELEAVFPATDQSAIAYTVVAPFPFELMHAALAASSERQQRATRVLCPGQYADGLEPDQIDALWPLANWVVGNEHEMDCLVGDRDCKDKTLITTRGPGPVTVTTPHGSGDYPVASAAAPLDPTGCGDAFLAGYLHAALSDSSIADCVQSGVGLAQRCLARPGPQRHFD